MSFPISRVTTWNANDTLTASDLNAEFNNIINNMEPADIDDASSNAAAMRATADPYPASSESLATNILGELQRIRYVIAQITSKTYWYQDPDASLAGAMEDNTYCVFYQDTAPTNWTIENTLNDKLMFVTKGSAAGGQTGGGAHSSGTWTQPNHTHTMGTHIHTMGTHIHTMGTHVHQWYNQRSGQNDQSYDSNGAESTIGVAGSAGNIGLVAIDGTSAKMDGSQYTKLVDPGDTNATDPGDTNATDPGDTNAGATANTWRPAAYCVIIAQRA